MVEHWLAGREIASIERAIERAPDVHHAAMAVALRSLRLEHEWSMPEVERRGGPSANALRSFECGAEYPAPEAIRHFAAAFGWEELLFRRRVQSIERALLGRGTWPPRRRASKR